MDGDKLLLETVTYRALKRGKDSLGSMLVTNILALDLGLPAPRSRRKTRRKKREECLAGVPKGVNRTFMGSLPRSGDRYAIDIEEKI